MWCAKNKATISIHCCIIRQNLIEEYFKPHKKSNYNDIKLNDTDTYKDLNLNKLKKCLMCKKGKLIKENPHKKFDVDIRKILYMYDINIPPKYKLKRKIMKYKLKVKI